MADQVGRGREKKSCACKGVRTCLLCESLTFERTPYPTNRRQRAVYNFCVKCSKGWKEDFNRDDHLHTGSSVNLSGISIWVEFVTETEELQLCSEINKTPFVDSQSGRRKQDYGPRVNFKKKKLNCADFTGLPEYSKVLYQRMATWDVLKDFLPVEQCNLEYVPNRGSSIDPHFDDFWLWGDRLVTLNLLSDTCLCMSNDKMPDIEVHVPLRRRSLVVLCGEARYQWKHGIHRQDITEKRIAMTFRELTPEFLLGGKQSDVGTLLIKKALAFSGRAVGLYKC